MNRELVFVEYVKANHLYEIGDFGKKKMEYFFGSSIGTRTTSEILNSVEFKGFFDGYFGNTPKYGKMREAYKLKLGLIRRTIEDIFDLLRIDIGKDVIEKYEKQYVFGKSSRS